LQKRFGPKEIFGVATFSALHSPWDCLGFGRSKLHELLYREHA